MLDQLRQIAIFAKVIDHGSFRAAATALQLSPSVVSHHITQLEDRLGVALIYRSTRKLALTPDGERLLRAAYAMLDAAQSGLAELSTVSERPSGELRVTMPALFAQSALVERIAAFSNRYPLIQLHLDFSETRRDLISDGFDLAIRAGWLQDSAFVARKIDEIGRRLVVAPSCMAQRPTPRSLTDLRDWPWIRFAPVGMQRPKFSKPGHAQVELMPKSHISVNDAQAMRQLAIGGAGLTVLPDFLTEAACADGRLVHLFPDWSAESIGVYAIWPANAPKHGLTKLFVDTLVG